MSGHSAFSFYCLPMFFQAVRERRVVCITGAGSRIDYDIHRRQFVLMQTKGFTNQALDAVASNRIADQARSDRQTQARMRTVIMPCENGKEIIGETARVLVDAIEFGFLPQTLCRCERPRVNLQVEDRKSTRREELASYTDNRLRPFARRRARIARPPRVAMRARKPCVRCR
jgi:hypothetical protein